MTRILVLSDSHASVRMIRRIPAFCRKAGIDRIFHLGDLVEDARDIESGVCVPVDFVAGNCDFTFGVDSELCIMVEGKRLLLTHGNRFGVKRDLDRLSYYAEEAQMDAALFGHTHQPFTGYLGKVLMINPGALQNGFVCVLEVTPEKMKPRIVNLNME